MLWESFKCHLTKRGWLRCVVFPEQLLYYPDWCIAAVIFAACSHLSVNDFWSSVRVTITTYPHSLSFIGQPNQGGVLMFSHSFHFTITEVIVLLGALRGLEMVLSPCPDLCFAAVLPQRSIKSSSDLIARLLFWHQSKLWGLYRHLVPVIYRELYSPYSTKGALPPFIHMQTLSLVKVKLYFQREAFQKKKNKFLVSVLS